MATKSTIRFELNRDRIDKDGFAPIRLVYKLEYNRKRERKIIPTGKKIRPANWQGGKAIYLTKMETKKLLPGVNYNTMPLAVEIEFLNSYLESLKTKIRAIESNFELNEKDYQLQEVVDIYNAKSDKAPQAKVSKPKINIDDFIEDYIKRSKGIVNAGTLRTYGSLLSQLKKFGAKKQDKLTFAYLDKSKLDNLLKHYINSGYENSYTAKHFSILKKLIKIAIGENKDLEVHQAFRDYSPSVLRGADSDNDVITLDQNEFDLLMDFDLSDYSKKVPYTKMEKGQEKQLTVSFKTLDKVRNLFVFSCTTGLRYSDLADLKREHIQGGWIKKRQVKGGKIYKIEIPLNAISSYILSIYEGQLKPLPKISNQKANDYIKIIGRLAGINASTEITQKTGTQAIDKIYPKCDLMSMHMGRRVFSTLTLEKGGAMQDVMSLTGHKKFANFKRYMHIGKKQKEKTMDVWNSSKPLKIAK